MIYNPGQAAELFEFWPANADWFVIGGPSDGNEAETVKVKYPSIKCIGFEANQEYLSVPFPGNLYHVALWDEDKIEIDLYVSGQGERGRSSSVCRPGMESCPSVKVKTRTLDSLSKEFGPFDNAVLWLDVEYAEYPALQGAKELLGDRKILLLNLELWDRGKDDPNDTYHKVHPLLTNYGFELVKKWARSLPNKFDAIYRLR